VLKVAPHLFREYMYLQHDIRVYGSINDDVHLTSSNDKPMDTASRQLQPAALLCESHHISYKVTAQQQVNLHLWHYTRT